MAATSRTNALTVMAPLKRWRYARCRIELPFVGMLASASHLADVRVIHFGEWVVTRRLSPPRAFRRPRRAMLFLADFDGDLDEYLAVFGLVLTGGMRATFGHTVKFPYPRPTRKLIDYVEARRSTEQVRWAAYDATVHDIDTALALLAEAERRLADDPGTDLLAQARNDPELLSILARAPQPQRPGYLRSALAYLRGGSTVVPLTVATPLDPRRVLEVEARLKALGDQRPSVFEGVRGAHIGRLALLPDPGRVTPDSRHRNLLVSARLDRGDDPVERLVGGFGDLADQVWDGCMGYPGTGDRDALVSWVRAHRLEATLYLAPLNGAPVERVKEALALYERALDEVVDR